MTWTLRAFDESGTEILYVTAEPVVATVTYPDPDAQVAVVTESRALRYADKNEIYGHVANDDGPFTDVSHTVVAPQNGQERLEFIQSLFEDTPGVDSTTLVDE